VSNVLDDYRFTLFLVLIRAKCSFFSSVGSVFIAVGSISETVGSMVLMFVNRFRCRLVVWKCGRFVSSCFFAFNLNKILISPIILTENEPNTVLLNCSDTAISDPHLFLQPHFI